MKIRRPDADKARKHLERQHMDAAARAARVVRPRRAPAGMGSPTVIRMADAIATSLRTGVKTAISDVVLHLAPAEGETLDIAAALRTEAS